MPENENQSGDAQGVESSNLFAYKALAKKAGVSIFEITKEERMEGWDGTHGYFYNYEPKCQTMGCKSFEHAVKSALKERMGKKLSKLLVKMFLANVTSVADATESDRERPRATDSPAKPPAKPPATPAAERDGVDVRCLVSCFCTPANDGTSNVIAFACDETGATLSQHYCSGGYWAKKDIMDECHHHRYPKGFVFEWKNDPPRNWDKASTCSSFLEKGTRLLWKGVMVELTENTPIKMDQPPTQDEWREHASPSFVGMNVAGETRPNDSHKPQTEDPQPH
jgi:hypothetical protein